MVTPHKAALAFPHRNTTIVRKDKIALKQVPVNVIYDTSLSRAIRDNRGTVNKVVIINFALDIISCDAHRSLKRIIAQLHIVCAGYKYGGACRNAVFYMAHVKKISLRRCRDIYLTADGYRIRIVYVYHGRTADRSQGKISAYLRCPGGAIK